MKKKTLTYFIVGAALAFGGALAYTAFKKSANKKKAMSATDKAAENAVKKATEEAGKNEKVDSGFLKPDISQVPAARDMNFLGEDFPCDGWGTSQALGLDYAACGAYYNATEAIRREPERERAGRLAGAAKGL